MELCAANPPAAASPGESGQVQRVSLAGGVIRMPSCFPAFPEQGGLVLYRAATAHAAAHLIHSAQRFPVHSLRPVQVALVSLIEDARVEHLAAREAPGLWRLWRPFHVALPSSGASAVPLMARLARALADPDYRDDDPWVAKGRDMFMAGAARLEDPALSRVIGVRLGNDLGQMRVQFNARTYVVGPPYRDDNLSLWDPGEARQPPADDQNVIVRAARPEVADAAGPSLPAPAAAGMKEARGQSVPVSREPWKAIADPEARRFRYDEWDYVIGLDRPDWCTVVDRRARPGDTRRVDDALDRHRDTVTRLCRLFGMARVGRVVRRRRELEGDGFDLDACVDAMLSLRGGRPPDPRVHTRRARGRRDLAVLVLLDLSQSTSELVASAGTSILELARDATALLASAMDRVGDDFAIHGFDSNGRHEVEYHRVKDLGEPYDDEARARLAGLSARFSTRIGTALRHAGQVLRSRRIAHKLVLVMTDGAPHDVDVHDRRYLVFDARRAVEELARAGIVTFCISLDASADEYVTRIFSARNYLVLDHVRKLPEELPRLYLRLTSQ
jgi:nitric oxide reductase NorD protein